MGYRGEGTSVGANEDKYKLWYCGGEGRENGVGIFINLSWQGVLKRLKDLVIE